MKKCSPIFAPGWMSIPVRRMGPFGHHPRDERDLQLVQQMGQAIDRHRLQARVAEDHFIGPFTAGSPSNAACTSRASSFAQLGQLLEELDRFGLAEGLEIVLVGAHFAGPGVVPQGPADLHGQLVVQPVDQLADVVGDVSHVQPFAAAKAGIENLLEVLADPDDHLELRQRAMAQMVDRRDLAIGLHDPIGQLGQLLFEAKIGGHCALPASTHPRRQNR